MKLNHTKFMINKIYKTHDLDYSHKILDDIYKTVVIENISKFILWFKIITKFLIEINYCQTGEMVQLLKARLTKSKKSIIVIFIFNDVLSHQTHST